MVRFILSYTDEPNFHVARPLHSDWLCMTLLTTTCDVTVTLFIDKINVREVILCNKNSTILNLINYTQIFVIYYKKVVGLLITKKVVGLLIISIDLHFALQRCTLTLLNKICFKTL